MSPDPDERTYDDLAFENMVKILCHTGPRVPEHVPDGMENLTESELTVLAYLQDVSSRRRAQTDDEPEAGAASAEPLAALVSAIGVPTSDDDLPNAALADGRTGNEAGSGPVAQTLAIAPKDGEIGADEARGLPSEMASMTSDPELPEGGNDASVDVSPEPEVTPPAANTTDETAVELTLDDEAPDGPVREDMAGDAPAQSPTDDSGLQEDSSMIIGPGGIPKVGPANTRPDPERINLRNGRTRQPYVDVIQGYNDIVLRDDGGTGLTIALDGTVSGGPLPAGEYTMMLDALRFGQSVSLRARVSIIADPRDLWKNIPSDQNAALAKPDEAFDSQAADAVIIAASKRGRSHAQEGKYRDDHFRICANTETGWHILVVADGAGSAELSREGSRIACDTVMDVLPQLLADLVDPNLDSIVADFDTASEPSAWFQSTKALLYPVLPKAALHAAHAIEKQAAGHERPAQEFATTIVIAVSRQVADKWFTASFTVGDGGVAVFDAEAARVDVLCRPDSGEFAGQTRFLATSEFREAKDVLERLFVDLRHGFTVLAAMTDGITDPKFPTDALLAKADSWTAFWDDDLCPQVWLHPDNPNLKEEMLGWLDFWSRGNHDDRTIALMIPVPPEPPADAGETQATEVSVADQADDSGAADT